MNIATLKDLLSDVEISTIKRKPYMNAPQLLDTLVCELSWQDLAQIWLCLEHEDRTLPAGVFVANCANELHRRIMDKGFLIY